MVDGQVRIGLAVQVDGLHRMVRLVHLDRQEGGMAGEMAFLAFLGRILFARFVETIMQLAGLRVNLAREVPVAMEGRLDKEGKKDLTHK